LGFDTSLDVGPWNLDVFSVPSPSNPCQSVSFFVFFVVNPPSEFVSGKHFTSPDPCLNRSMRKVQTCFCKSRGNEALDFLPVLGGTGYQPVVVGNLPANAKTRLKAASIVAEGNALGESPILSSPCKGIPLKPENEKTKPNYFRLFFITNA
jgi:hypothetical protein